MSNDTGNLVRGAALLSMVAGTLLALTHRPAAAQQASIGSETPGGVLILRNGNVIQGRIQRAENHFRVAVEGGEVSVRVSDVEFFCRDLDEAYQRKRAGLTPGDARGHVLLAQWCHKHGLLGGGLPRVGRRGRIRSVASADFCHPTADSDVVEPSPDAPGERPAGSVGSNGR